MSNQYARNDNSVYREYRNQEYDLVNDFAVGASAIEIPFASPVTDNLIGVASYTGAGDWVILKDGVFEVDATIVWNSVGGGSTGVRRTYVEINQDTREISGVSQNAVSGTVLQTIQSIHARLNLIAGDSFNIKGFQNQGGNLNAIGSSTDAARYCRCSITYTEN